MTTEVELKYLVLSENVSKTLFELLKTQQLSFSHKTKKLTNSYFDTPELALRKLDMGLRIRIDDNHIEQTIKTAGIVVGGLHQRPEYNVNIEQPFPVLSLFPEHIWPESELVEQLQTQLIPLFSTDFTREIWEISYQKSVIEVAFDQGIISSAGRSCDICELELELLAGERDDVFALAKLFFSTLLLRAGTESKAARGYQLFADQTRIISATQLDIRSSKVQVNEYFIAGINHCLQNFQKIMNDYLCIKELTKLAELVDVLSLMRHGFWLFDDSLSDKSRQIRAQISYFIQLFAWVDNAIYLRELMNKTGNYRKKLQYSNRLIEQLKIEKKHFPDHQMVVQLLHSERINLLQLDLLSLIVDGTNSDCFNRHNEDKQLVSFAQTKLSDSLALLHKSIAQCRDQDAEQYLAQRKLLHRSLLTGHWFGELFDEQRRIDFRTPWIDIKAGLRELQSLWIIKQQLEKLDTDTLQDNGKIIHWQQSKVENLLMALSHSKNVALVLPEYWLS